MLRLGLGIGMGFRHRRRAATGITYHTLIDTLANSYDLEYGTPIGPIGMSFTSDSVATRINVTITATAPIEGTGGSCAVKLHADAGGAPGAALVTIGNVTDAQLYNVTPPAQAGGIVVFSGVVAALEASTRYWIMVSDNLTGGQPSGLLWAGSVDPTGAEGEYAYTDNAVFLIPDDGFPFLMLVEAG